MKEAAAGPGNELRKDGDPETAFKNAAQVLEWTYTAPFLAHNTMEFMNCFAHVTAEKVKLRCLNFVNTCLVFVISRPCDSLILYP
jgi:isoquinoline 1-oxidoreductase beta subunit